MQDISYLDDTYLSTAETQRISMYLDHDPRPLESTDGRYFVTVDGVEVPGYFETGELAAEAARVRL